MRPRGSRRRLLGAFVCGSFAAGRAHALMAGLAPDSPQRRLDPNTPESPWSGVGSITGGGGVYSGVLLTRRFALTAHHVLPPDPASAFFNLNIGGDISHRLRVRRAVRHPSPLALGNGMHSGDLALLELEDPAPPEAHAYAIAPGVPPPGTPIALVGYGASGSGDRGVSVAGNAALKRVGENLIERYIAAPGGRAPLLYLFRFDAPPGAGKTRTQSLGNLRETGLASGDSGSPAFVTIDGIPHLLGINSFVTQAPAEAHVPYGFGTFGGGQLLAPHRAWIESVISAP